MVISPSAVFNAQAGERQHPPDDVCAQVIPHSSVRSLAAPTCGVFEIPNEKKC